MTSEDQRAMEYAQQLEQAERTGGRNLAYRAGRFVTRCGRIVAGGALFLVALYLLGKVLDVLDTSFAAMTLGKVLGGIFYAILCYLMVIWSWNAAFGPAPTIEQRRAEFLRTARASLAERDKAEQEANRTQHAAGNLEAVFRGLGRKVGGLLNRR